MMRELSRSWLGGENNPREGEASRSKEIYLGDLWLSIGSIGDALAYYQTALGQAGEACEEMRIGLVKRIAECLRRQAKLQDALEFLDSVMDGFTSKGRRSVIAEKVKILCLIGKYGEAASICNQLLADGPDSGDDPEIYLVMGQIMARTCRWRKAILCFEHAAGTAAMNGDRSLVGKAFNNLGIVYKNLCAFDESAKFLSRAIRIDRDLKDEAGLAVKLLNLSITLYKQGDLAAAIEAVEECLPIARRLSLKRTELLATISKARIEGLRGNLEIAQPLIAQVLAKEDVDPRTKCIAYEVASELAAQRGEYRKAINKALKGLEALPADALDVKGELMSRLASFYLKGGDKAKARSWVKRAYDVATQAGDLYEVARCLRTMAAIFRAQGSYLGRAEKLFRKMKARFELAITLHQLARRQGKHSKRRINLLKRAILLYRRCSATRNEVDALCDLAISYAEIGRFERALTCLGEGETLVPSGAHRVSILCARRSIDAQMARAISLGMFSELPRQSIMDSLKIGLKAEGIAFARIVDGDRLEMIEVVGISRCAAMALLESALKSHLNPFVTTDLASLAPDCQTHEIGLAVAIKIQPKPGGIVGIFWKDAVLSKTPLTALAVKGCYSVLKLLPDLQRALAGPLPVTFPICLAGIVTADTAFKRILLSLRKIASGSANVLITGETGTGKDLIARAIHLLSDRRDKPFVAQNCAALPEHLLESELFGHRAGSFTGARQTKPGLLEIADGGSFFLDEIGDLSPAMQAKLLRAIESKEIRRVGDTVVRPVNARFLSATNKDLEVAVEKGEFRRDLYYRLNVVSIHIPPLRNRRVDIPILAQLFLSRFARKFNKVVKGFSQDGLSYLLRQSWPGNVRQLENEVEKALTVAEENSWITSEQFRSLDGGFAPLVSRRSLKEELRSIEKQRIISVLEHCDWNKTHAARMLGGISRPALIAKMKRLGIPLRRVA